MATKYLNMRYLTNLKEKLYLIYNEKILNKKNINFQSDEFKEYLKLEKLRKSKEFIPETEDKDDNIKKIKSDSENKNSKNEFASEKYNYNDSKFLKQMGLIFMKKCEHFCNALKWDIPTYKCIFRNIGNSEFDSVLIKCGAFGLWELVGRNSKSVWLDKKSKKNLNKVILGNQFYMENLEFKIDLHYLPYITPSIIRPFSKLNFFLNFNFTDINEYLFSSGDMEYYTVIDKKDLFIKGYPYNVINSNNNKLISNINKNKLYNYESSIYNPVFSDENFDNQGIVIFENKVFGFSDNSKE